MKQQVAAPLLWRIWSYWIPTPTTNTVQPVLPCLAPFIHRRHILNTARALTAIALIAVMVGACWAAPVLIEAESFEDHGGWVLDAQSMDQMGSPYLLAHGLGKPVKDATTTVTLPGTGPYRVWVRTKDWVAPWKAPGTPGKFQVLLDGKALPTVFGTEGAEWHWQDGGVVSIPHAGVKIGLHDLTGFEGRCDALLFSADPAYVPPQERAAITPAKSISDGGRFDLVVVGGGLAGACAAVKAARLGLSVALIQDRPVLGGNGSSEVRVWPIGQIKLNPYPHVGEIVAELVQDQKPFDGDGNVQPPEKFGDERKLAVVKAEKNITLLLNHRVNAVEAVNGVIHAVIAQDVRHGDRVRVSGLWFADCTGDATVGFLAGADYEVSREEHMGMSNPWGALKCECPDEDVLNSVTASTGKAAPFPRCPWALDLTKTYFRGRPGNKPVPKGKTPVALGGYSWESGFHLDPIADVELIRDLNFRAMYGAWDAVKNVDNAWPTFELGWAAFVAGKRESRRLLGDVVVTGDDLRKGRKFEDAAFPCTWVMDVHIANPAYSKEFSGTEFMNRADYEKYPIPFWAPYRSLYSRNVSNLWMAGRNISVDRNALGAVRVMKTCGMMGEVVGMAASLCKQHGTTPRGVYQHHLEELKSLLSASRPASPAGTPRK